jgi:hypothetical protein
MKKNQNLELKKHVAAIHSANKISLVQRKIANALLFNAYHELLECSEHRISIKELCALTGYHSHDYQAIKQALISLLSTVVEWNLVDKDRVDEAGVWNASSIIADASITGSVCTYSYSGKMKQLLYNPLVYGRLNMQTQAKFKSSYGLALYENCIRYQNIEITPWFLVELFRKLMGVPEDKYGIFRDLKRRVIDKAVLEVNTHATFSITPQYQKQGRQVLAIRFKIKHAEDQPQLSDVVIKPPSALTHRLTQEFGLTMPQIEALCAKYDEAYILEKIGDIVASPSYREGKIVNLAKYLEGALKGAYKKLAVEGGGLLAAKSESANPPIALQHKLAFRKYQEDYILAYYQGLDDKARKKLLAEFEKLLEGGLYLAIYHRDGLQNVLICDQFFVFIKVSHEEWLRDSLHYEAFCQSMELTNYLDKLEKRSEEKK